MAHNPANNVTSTGTLMSSKRPCIKAIGIISRPAQRIIIGSVTSIDVTPAAEMTAYRPNHYAIQGPHTSAVISRMMLTNRASIPSCVAACRPITSLLSSTISTDESE